MSGKKAVCPEPNLVPRRERTLNRRQERFVLALLEGMGKVEAIRHAGYQVATDDAARDAASRLLRNPSIKVAIERAKLKAIEKMDRTAEATLLRYHNVYLEAMAAKDYSAAVSALRDIAKYHGMFERNNQQRKNYTEQDIARMKARLEEKGFDFRRRALVNQPGFDEKGYPLPEAGEN